MSNRLWWCCSRLPAILLLSFSVPSEGQAPSAQPAARNLPDMTFATIPGLPTCALGAGQAGDPSKGPSLLISKVAAGCSIPWHWHSPNEHLMMVSGMAELDVKGGKPLTLRPGGFVLMPSRHVHQFRCTAECVFYVYSDGAFDLHYLDAQGNEITPDDALKAVKETAAKPTT